MYKTFLLFLHFLVIYHETAQLCYGLSLTPSYGLCDVGGAITSFNGSITGNSGNDCTRLIFAPKGYRIEVTIYKNTRVGDPADLSFYDGGTNYNNPEVTKFYRYHEQRTDQTVTSTSNALVIQLDKLSTRTTLNMTFTMFRQPSTRCECLPIIRGQSKCILSAGIHRGDILERECTVNCMQEHYIPSRNILVRGQPYRLSCSMDHNKHIDKWETILHHDKLDDENQITCSKVNIATQVVSGFSFSYYNISCQNVNVKFIESRVRGQIVNRTSVPSVGECFKNPEAKDNPNCTVESVNVSCTGVNNDTASQITLLVHDNILQSANLTMTRKRYNDLYSSFRNNLTSSLRQFIAENLAIGNASAAKIDQLSQTYLISNCPENEIQTFQNIKLGTGCINCPTHFQKVHPSSGLYHCVICANGTRRKNEEQTCTPGLRNYSKPSYDYCQHTCSLGKYFNVNSTLCEWCPYGTYQNSTSTVNPTCKTCPDNKTTGFVGAKGESECIHLCPAGQYLRYLTCENCGVGYFMPNESNRLHKCYKCPLGNTTLDIGTKSIDACIDKCSMGEYFNISRKACLPCPNNTYQDEVNKTNTRSCKNCPPNTVTAHVGSRTSAACLGPCGAGQYVDILSEKCSPCPQNTYYNMADHVSFSCKPCGMYKITQNIGSRNVSECIYNCGRGEFFNKTINRCGKCEVNTFQNEIGSDFCKLCPGKTFTLTAGSKICISPCQYGQFLNKSAEHCQNCSNGYYQNISDHRSDKCYPCPLDFYNNNLGTRNCTACPGQTITVVTGAISQSECINACEPSTFLNKSRKSCQKCLKGFYQDQHQYRLEHCKECPFTNLTTMESGSTNLEQCVGYCTSSPCLNGGECVNVVNGFNCTCPRNLQGKRCEVITDAKDTDFVELSVRFPDLEWNQSLLDSNSMDFIELARKIENTVRDKIDSDAAFRTVKVKQFKPGSVISLLELSFVAGVNFTSPVDTFYAAIDDGKLGNLTTDKSSLEVVNFTCTQPLGMENGRIPDKAITSGISVNYHQPPNARLNSPGPGWAPQSLIGNDIYLQVDFQDVILLTAVATQGSSFQGGSWLQAYFLQYSSDGRKWTYYKGDGIVYEVGVEFINMLNKEFLSVS